MRYAVIKKHKGRIVAIRRGFSAGVVDMLDVLGSPKPRKMPASGRSSRDALKGDWGKLGGDMRRATQRVMREQA